MVVYNCLHVHLYKLTGFIKQHIIDSFNHPDHCCRCYTSIYINVDLAELNLVSVLNMFIFSTALLINA